VVFDVPRADAGALSTRDFKALLGQAQFVGVTAFGTVFDEAAVDLVASLDVAAIRIASARRAAHPLLARAAQTGKPLFLATGAASPRDVDEALALCEASPVAVVAASDVAGILARHPNRPAGLQAPPDGLEAAREAVRQGACLIETTFALGRRAEMSALVREVEAS
jgi:N-acetylneuraminate synthase